jgi:hypothetical protein
MARVRYATKLISLTYNALIYVELLSLSCKLKYCFQFYDIVKHMTIARQRFGKLILEVSSQQ